MGLAQAVELDTKVGAKRAEGVVVGQLRANAHAKSRQIYDVAVLGGKEVISCEVISVLTTFESVERSERRLPP